MSTDRATVSEKTVCLTSFSVCVHMERDEQATSTTITPTFVTSFGNETASYQRCKQYYRSPVANLLWLLIKYVIRRSPSNVVRYTTPHFSGKRILCEEETMLPRPKKVLSSTVLYSKPYVPSMMWVSNSLFDDLAFIVN